MGKRPEREGWLVELVGYQNTDSEAPAKSKGDVRGGATARGVMEKSRCVRVLEREEGAKKFSGKKRLPDERWRKVGVSGSWSERRSEEMTQSNTSSSRG